MPRYKLSNGKIIFSETKLSPEELEEYEGESTAPTGPQIDTSKLTGNIPSQKPITPQAPKEEESGFLKQVWDAVNKPMIETGLSPEMRAFSEQENPILGRVMNFGTDLLSGLSSPLNVATAGTFGAAGALAGKLPQIARALRLGGAGLSAPVAVEGGIDLANAETGGEAAVGGLELLGGILGMKQGLPRISKNIVDDAVPENVDLSPRPKQRGAFPAGPTKDRLDELIDKSREGTLTGDELIEAKKLDKQLRNADLEPFDEPEVKPQHTIVDTKNPKPQNLIHPTKPNLILDAKRGVFVNKATGEEIPLNDPVMRALKPFESFKSDPGDQISMRLGAEKLPDTPLESFDAPMQGSIYFGGKKPPDTPFTKVDELLEQPEIEPTRIQPKVEFLKEGASSIKAIMSAIDLPPLRQGLPAIMTKGWWTSWDDMVKSYGSQKAFDGVQESITSDPLFANYKAAGGTFTDQITNKEDQWTSAIMKKNVPGTNFNPLRGGQRGSIAFLNKTRFDNFKSMYNHARNAAMQPGLTPDEKILANPATNDLLAKKFASFVNDATGRGSLNFSKTGEGLANLEKVSDYLNAGMWSPHLMSSRIRMFKRYLDPRSYTTESPEIRRETLKSLIGVAGAWGVTAGLASQIPGVEVSLNSNNPDFGKVRIGNSRQDFSGAFAPYIVAASRFATGFYTTSTSNETQELGQEFGGQTRESVIRQFMVNKTSPLVNFAHDLFAASEGRPFNVADRTLQLVMPMMIEDLISIMKEDPTLIPMMLPSLVGTSSQTYAPGDTKKGKIIPREWDWQITGGSPWR